MADRKDEKNISNKVEDETILVCANEDWEGKASERLKERGEQDGVKGHYRVCPVCKSKDFYTKPKTQNYKCLTFSIDPEVEDIVRKYTHFHGLPKKT